MKKKLLSAMLGSIAAVAVVVPFSASAAPMSASAKAGDAVVDGVISDGEYGDAFELNGQNGVTWAGLGAISKPITYRFAWSEKGLYIALSYDKAVEGSSMLQINCNPGGQLADTDQGLFVTVNPAGTVLLHNHNTVLADVSAETAAVDVTEKVTIASKETGDTKVTEVLIPMAAFQIKGKNESYKFAAGEMACSAFAVLTSGGAAAETGAAISGTIVGPEDWVIGKMGFGKLTLAAAADPKPDDKPSEPEKPDDKPSTPSTGDAVAVSAIVVAVAAGAALMISKKSKAAK